MIKFIHGIIFRAIWAWTALCIIAACSLIAINIYTGTIGYFSTLINLSHSHSYATADPLDGFLLFIMAAIVIVAILLLCFLVWFPVTVGLLNVAYYTRPQAWPEHYGMGAITSAETIVEAPATQFNKAIYGR